jgi:hypothetical protein
VIIYLVAHYLNPKFQYTPEIIKQPEHLTAVTQVFERLFPNDDCDNIGNTLLAFRDAKGMFSNKSAVAGRTNMASGKNYFLFPSF